MLSSVNQVGLKPPTRCRYESKQYIQALFGIDRTAFFQKSTQINSPYKQSE